MFKSNKCDYTIGTNKVVKKKYLTPDLAIKQANYLNTLPNIIKKFVPYKCTVCHFFHVGRSNEDNIQPEENNPFTKNVVIPEVQKVEPIIEIPRHDDFDWDTDKRIF